MDRTDVYRALNSERDYQDQKWGTVEQHPHSIFEWLEIMAHYMQKANNSITCEPATPHEIDVAVIELRKAVAVGIAALEQHSVPQRTTRPTIVCLCGSTRFWREFQRISLEETLAGKIVLSIGAASGTDDEHFGNLPKDEYDRVKTMLDELHLRKIDMADEVLILNVNGYMGESTTRERDYALAQGKHVRYLVPPIAEGCEWSYEGAAIVDVGGGGYLKMRLGGPFILPRPESGHWEIVLQLRERQPDEEASNGK